MHPNQDPNHNADPLLPLNQPQPKPQQEVIPPQQAPQVVTKPTANQPLVNTLPTQSPPKKHSYKKLFITLGVIVGILVLLFVLLVIAGLTQFKRYQENGPSMAPTINNGQMVTVKEGYTTPHINDIVVFTQSGLSQYDQPNTLQLIKRIVALPGDRVVIANNKLTVFDSAHPNGFDPDSADGLSSQVTSGNVNTTIPNGEVFVLGDNRQQSIDSRMFGAVPISNIIGKVILN